MSFFHDDLSGFGAFPIHGHNPHDALGQQVTLSDDGVLSPFSAGKGGGHGGGGGGGGGGGSGSGSGSTGGGTGGTPPPPTQQPGSTLVTAAGSNLAIDLIWDSSVSSAPTGFTSAVIAAVSALVTDLSAPRATELYINVGWGEVAGQALSSGDLGESQSNGYLSSYATVANALKANGDVVSASNEPTSAQFFVTSAEAKVLGISSGSSPDGYIGFAALSNWQFNATGTGAGQYNLQAMVQHEVTEVMGRDSMEGTVTYNGVKTYTPLDLFDFSANGVLALSNAGGYFSSNNGATQMGVFNNASTYGGDIADWSSYASNSASQTLASTQQDPFDAFSRTGYDLTLSGDDLLVMAAVGYKLTPTGSALA